MAGLEVNEHLAFQEHQWRWERIGWGIFAIILIGALLGLFGNGPLSASTASTDDDTLTVAWERIVRRQGLAELQLTIDPGAIQQGEVTIWLDPTTASQVQRVNPEPAEVVVSSDRLSWTFAADPAAGPVTIMLELTPTEMGWQTVSLGIEQGAALDIRQIVLP